MNADAMPCVSAALATVAQGVFTGVVRAGQAYSAEGGAEAWRIDRTTGGPSPTGR